MNAALEDPQCAPHQELALTTCDRCGSFMCERCARYGTETRCQSCRPKRKAPEIAERRQNAVRRATWVRCLGCEYRGPRLERFQRLPLLTAALAPLALLFGIWPGIVLMSRASDSDFPCPSCGGLDQLYPLTPSSRVELDPEAMQALEREAKASKKVRTRNTLKIIAALALWVTGLTALITKLSR